MELDYYTMITRIIFEVIFRSTIMFTVLLLTLKSSWKTWRVQLSVFETVIIAALGSAAGDPMFYEEVGIILHNRISEVIILCTD
jgi:uncharacterized membrane protein YcaP (DUF421 family)